MKFIEWYKSKDESDQSTIKVVLAAIVTVVVLGVLTILVTR